MNKSQKLKTEYEIRPDTMAIIPHTYGSKTFSMVKETTDSFIVPKKPLEIIKESCGYFGSSYPGRKEGTKQLMSITHKAPVAIDPYHFIYFFPTHSPSREQCSWISLLHVLHFSETNQNDTDVKFVNNEVVTIPTSIDAFRSQLFRTSFLMVRFIQRMDLPSKKWFMIPPKVENGQAFEEPLFINSLFNR
ncbi:competence protein ComK [Bacillus oleivorans]|uniref:Competence protein ComK n=1 Tax=Bacillus oleivorans TaxID=1448271 RepID=A0A285CSL7_9BACI|nr:competence protein ComK [Bacillus oleivorans]SNX70046.1 competence protein ComK [Bacillus oleivorans]